ncbi:uncharacterized protein LOC124910587 [Impatiens glandulifera]|uniref:uncharacterized protein LOC124910587 n=1 Tax=Impatiens glandulifera TaxID=253017 RepID=UPI001FB0F9AF|nr:uncharacterized protein LOC124910587 [Impatiens glandulifera]
MSSSPATFNGGFQVTSNNIHDPTPSMVQSLIPNSSTPLLHFSGVPFSWEHCPGIPKKMNKDPFINNNLLPLPPAGNCFNTNSNLKSKKTKKTTPMAPKDPFLAAIVECSRSDNEDDEGDNREINFWKGSKAVTRILSNRFGFINMYSASCKQACPVSESIIYVARPGGAHYQRRRSGR